MDILPLPDSDLLKLDILSSHGTPVRDVFMTRSTEEHGLPSEGYHPLHPFRLFPSWVLVNVFHGSDMVDFYVICTSTEFTDVR